MPRDTLETLVKVRRLACDDALRILVEALAREDRALQASHDIERSVAQESLIATDPASSDAVVEAFGQWLPEARRRLAMARQALQEHQVDTARRRAELTVCRTALESVEALQQQRRQTIRNERERALQRELEDRPRPHPASLMPDGGN